MANIIYKDVAPGAMEGATPAISDIQPFCDVGELAQNITTHPIGTLEPDYFKLDGFMAMFPNDPSIIEWGAWSQSVSSSDGTFETPIVLTLLLDGLYSSVGLTFRFDPYGPGWCNDLSIQWYRDSDLLSDMDFYPDDWEYSCINEVKNYNKVVVTFRITNEPYRYLKLKTPVYGIIRTFKQDELRSLNLFQACSPISEDLEINTMECTISGKDPIPYMFQRKQPMEVYHEDNLQGVFYISKSTRKAENLYDIEADDLVGLLSESNHQGGIYSSITFADIVAEIMGNYSYEMESGLEAITLSGWLPIATRRDNLAHAAFAAGAVVDTSGSNKVRIYAPKNTAAASFDADSIYSGSSIEIASVVTGVQVTEHVYSTTTESVELFNGTLLVGVSEITFSEPAHTLTITGGTITDSGANYAVINVSVAGVVVLSGKKYTDSTRVVTVSNPDVAATDISNIIQVTDATLVGASNSAEVAQRVYDYYQRRESINAQLLLSNELPGDMVTIATEFDGVKTGTIKSLDLDLMRKRIGTAVIVGA